MVKLTRLPLTLMPTPVAKRGAPHQGLRFGKIVSLDGVTSSGQSRLSGGGAIANISSSLTPATQFSTFSYTHLCLSSSYPTISLASSYPPNGCTLVELCPPLPPPLRPLDTTKDVTYVVQWRSHVQDPVPQYGEFKVWYGGNLLTFWSHHHTATGLIRGIPSRFSPQTNTGSPHG